MYLSSLNSDAVSSIENVTEFGSILVRMISDVDRYLIPFIGQAYQNLASCKSIEV